MPESVILSPMASVNEVARLLEEWSNGNQSALDAVLSPRKARVVELRFFGGLSAQEIRRSTQRLGSNGQKGLAACQNVAPARVTR